MSTEVGRLSYALNTMLAQIEQAFAQRDVSEQRLRQFVADASHELRTPLAVLRGYGELLRQGAVPESEIPATMARIENEAKVLGGLAEDLLTLMRLDETAGGDSGKDGAVPAREPVDLCGLVEDAARDLRTLDPAREVTVSALVAPAPSDTQKSAYATQESADNADPGD